MSRDIKAIARLKKLSEIYNLLIISFIVLLVLFIGFISGDDDMRAGNIRILIATLISGIYVGVNLFIKLITMADEITRGLTFGMTRKKLFVLERVADIAEILVVACIAFLLIGRGSMIVKLIILVFGLFNWVEGLAGNNMMRYGKKAFWVYYIIYFAVILIFPRTLGASDKIVEITRLFMDWIRGAVLGQPQLWTGVVIFAIVGLMVNWLTFRKIPVNYSV
ncbi:hypothetical protein D6856_04475 [Butyrivibrio sp. XB500-5]|uniref:hypothetical protein n=1 Tax=Butyrivibrio sp. XB500-5 TaxID=2364880 RepID=UPI000EA8E8DE|nr:hypothetical protein [Butyrivibrio sp. XB500-5]RKM63384.1 hypothetical protein D6856_04475 [Butyrivibrio sp. XB500-5]